jgi:hypothetical protein
MQIGRVASKASMKMEKITEWKGYGAWIEMFSRIGEYVIEPKFLNTNLKIGKKLERTHTHTHTHTHTYTHTHTHTHSLSSWKSNLLLQHLFVNSILISLVLGARIKKWNIHPLFLLLAFLKTSFWNFEWIHVES